LHRSPSYELVVSDAPSHAHAWDSRLDEFCDARPEQTHSYGAVLWGAQRLSQLELRHEGATVAMAQAVILKPSRLSCGMAYVKFGPLWKRADARATRDNLRAVLSAMVDEYAKKRGLHLVVMPQPDTCHDKVMHEELEQGGLISKRALRDPKRYLVDLSVGEEQLYRGLDQKWRYNLRLAEKRGLDLAMHVTPGATADYLQLHDEMPEPKRLKTASARILPRLHESLPEPLRPRIVLASRGSKPLAGAVVLQLGDTATYLFGATSRAGREAKAGYALHWWIARWLRGAGVRWYDLGGEAGEPGLRQFKKGLVGKNGCAHKLLGEYEAGSRPLSALAARLAFGLRDSQLLTLIRYHGLKLAGSLRAWLCISFVAA
jgi:hypothetical protein